MGKELKCPHCGSLNVDYSDCYDTEKAFDYEKENEIVIHRMNGYCEDCGATDLQWEEVYEFTGYQNIKVNN